MAAVVVVDVVGSPSELRGGKAPTCFLGNHQGSDKERVSWLPAPLKVPQVYMGCSNGSGSGSCVRWLRWRR